MQHAVTRLIILALLVTACSECLTVGTGVKSAVADSSLSADPWHHLSGVVTAWATQPPRRVPAAPVLAPWIAPVFGPNIDASLGNAFAQSGAAVAINPDDPQRIIISANDYRNGLKPYIYLSTDSGSSWLDYLPGGLGSNPLYQGNPVLAFGRGGLAYHGYQGYDRAQPVCGSQGGMYAGRSTDAGTSFSAPVLLAANSNNGTVAQLQDRAGIAVDNNIASPYAGTIYEAWTRFAFRSVAGCGTAATQLDASALLARSTDSGLNWSVPITVSPPISTNNTAGLPVVGLNDQVYLYYLGAQTQGQTGYDSVLFSRSTDGGQTFPLFTHIASLVDLPSPLPPTNFRVNAAGALAADGQVPGTLYAVWADYRNGDADILLSRSTDDGSTWGLPQRVNDDPLHDGRDQFFPWIAGSADGRLHIAWLDRRDDPANRNYMEYYTVSEDHGLTFAPNIAVSNAPSVPGNSNYIGDYTGLAVSSGIVQPAWTDIRDGSNQNIYTARGLTLAPTPIPSGTAATATITRTPIPTTTVTPPATDTPTRTLTATLSPTVTVTGTSTPTDTRTPTGTRTPTATRIPTDTATTTPCTLRFSDVQESDYFYPAVQYLACRRVVSGYGDGTFRPYTTATRAQLVKIVILGFGLPIQTPAAGAYTFSDVPTTQTFFSYVETAAGRRIISGYTCGAAGEPCDAQRRPYFRPQAPITRAQLAKIAVGTADWPLIQPGVPTFRDVPLSNTFYAAIETAVCHGILSGYSDNTFRPGNNALRGQIAKIIYGAITNTPTCTGQ